MVKVITYGTFDLLHHGHIRLLERAKALGDYLIVGVTADDFDKARGKINVHQSLMERLEAIRSLNIADEIIVEEYEGQKIDDIRRYNVDIFTVGSDWTGKFDYLNEYCSVVYLERTHGVSSSEIRAEKRKIRLGIVGNLEVKKRFEKEIPYINGIELIECDNQLSNVDAVYIASLPEEHYRDIRFALLSGKHVICESPVAIKHSEYLELTEIAKKNNLILADAIKTAYSTAYSRLLVLAKSGAIGQIVSVDSVCTSLNNGLNEKPRKFENEQNSMCAWGPTALLPVFQLLGTDYVYKDISSWMLDKEKFVDGFTKINFRYTNSVASVRIGKTVKSEGELVITGTKGYIYVPAPWWKTDYFEVRFENQTENKRYFYQLDGDGIRYEIVAFLKSIQLSNSMLFVENKVSEEIVKTVEDFYSSNVNKLDVEEKYC